MMNNIGSLSISNISGARARRRGNYTIAEDVSSWCSYIYVSTDTIINSDQKAGFDHNRTYKAYKEHKLRDAVVFSFHSVKTRVRLILKECVCFAACLKSTKDLNKSGVCEDDDIRLATALFNKLVVHHLREDV